MADTSYGVDPYGDAPYGVSLATDLSSDLSIFATFFVPWTPPVETDLWYAQLPFVESQAKLGEDGPVPPTFRVEVGWHGTRVDDERGSVALVQRGGALQSLIGERVRVSRRGRRGKTVVVFVKGSSTAISSDLSLSRRMFAVIGLLAEGLIDANVQVLVP